MRIERVRIEGFGALSGVDLAWPDGQLLLVADPNETGKTTLCEAIVAALYGFPRSRGGAIRPKELRRPRSGARLQVGLDVTAEGTRWSVDRDLEAGTVRIVDRDSGKDRTKEFLRGSGRDVFGERATGLTEALFRTTAYVGQNVLDGDSLDSTLTVELSRIADSGGGEASVVRAVKALEAVRAKMPEPTTGGSVSVETEILRARRRAEERRAALEKVTVSREEARAASERLAVLERERAAARRRVELAELAVVETERVLLSRRRSDLSVLDRTREKLGEEARRLSSDAALFTPELLRELDAAREKRGGRPEALEKARRELEAERRNLDEDRRERARRLGPCALLPEGERETLRILLTTVAETAEEVVTAEEALEAQWEELRREGLAEDLKRLEALPAADREFLAGAEEGRQSLELDGVKLDRKAADGAAQAAIAAGERKVKVRRARGLIVGAGFLLPFAGAFLLRAPQGSLPLATSLAAFVVGLALFGAVAWTRAARHRIDDEGLARREEAAAREQANRIRKSLSEVRRRLDQIARQADFRNTAELVRANRNARAAEEKRRLLLERRARLKAVAARREELETHLDRFRQALSFPAGLPGLEDTRRFLALLADVERGDKAEAARRDALALEAERILKEAEALAGDEARLRSLLTHSGIPGAVGFPEAFLMVEAGRSRAGRHREIVEVELPASGRGVGEDAASGLDGRLASLENEVTAKLAVLGASRVELVASETPEEARRVAEARRVELLEAGELSQNTERELARRAREGTERAREAEEALAEAEAALDRAIVFRDAVDLAREALSAATSEAYGDFRRGLAGASRVVLQGIRLPYEALEFADDLSVSVVARGGRLVTKADVAAGLSTGTREQIHLVARLAALRHLGTGSRGVPLLLDDPLVGADDQRFASVMRFLLSEVLRERPVLVVTCHGWRHDFLLEQLEPELKGRLRRISLRGTELGPGPDSEKQQRLPGV